jgi:hypothetical protein
MLVDTNISRAGVSKAKPQRVARPAIGAHARRPAAAQGAGKWWRHGIPVGLADWYGSAGTRIKLRGGDDASARGGARLGLAGGGGGKSGRRCASWERAASQGGDAHQGGAARRGDARR